jgi:NADPH:quinone reductase
VKAIRIHETGSPEVMRLDEVDQPAPAAGQVLIRVAVAGISYIDLMARQGAYDAGGPLPAILGTEVAGIVVAAGPGTPDDLVGTRVIAFAVGGYAEFATAPAELVTEVPADADLGEAMCYLTHGVAAWQLLTDCGRVRPGESVLVHAAAGGVGSIAVQLARVHGAATVLATAGSQDKRQLAKELGADVVLDGASPDWPGEVLAATGGRGADVVLDGVGGDVGEQSADCLAPFGRLAVYGVASKQAATFSGAQLMRKNQSVIGYWLAGRPPGGQLAIVRSLLELSAAGRVHGVVRHVYPLEEAAAAHRAIGDRRTSGKVILAI